MDQTRLEWALLGLIAVVCAVLSFLQYRWTGELRETEVDRFRSGLQQQTNLLARAFDDEIRENCTLLVPSARELREKGREEAHKVRYEQWAPSHDRGLFTRIGIAVPDQTTLRLYGMEGDGRMAPMQWPASWESLHTQLADRVSGSGPPPSVPANSILVESPVFEGGGRHGGGPELEWMIFEISEDYLRTKILPHLIAEYLNPGGESVYDVSIAWAGSNGPVIYSTRADKSRLDLNADSIAGLFPGDISMPHGNRRGHGRDARSSPRWIVAVRHQAGSLEAAVSRAQYRNLITSLALIGLLGGAAWALVRHTGRSRRLAEMQFRFAAGVSHDLRTPLTAIRGAAFNVAEGLITDPAAVGRYARMILRNAEELTSMIENVLAFSATLHRDREAGKGSFAIADLIEHAAAAMAQEVEQAGCRIEVAVAPDLPAVTGDPVAFEHALRNLIGNAIRHASGGKWIGVSAARSGDAVEIRVCDRGPGIPEAEQDCIFEPFYRGEQTRSAHVRGTGLGLSLVKEAVERHRGAISVHNSPGGGAQFTVRLPGVPEEA